MPDTNSLLSQVLVKIDGTDVSADFMRALLEVTVESSLHMADAATLVLHDPALKWIDSSLVAPGKSIEINTKATPQKSKARPVFDGEFVDLEPQFEQGTHRLIVRAFDRLHRLARGRIVRSFQNVTDSDIVQRIAQETGLQADVESTKQVHSYLFQNNQTNLEFLQERAAALGYVLYVERKKLCFHPLANADKEIELKWAAGLAEFRPRLTTIAQFNSVTTRGWDPQTKKEIVSEVNNGNGLRKIGQNKAGGEVAKNAFQMTASDLVCNEPIHTQSGADALAKAIANRHQEKFIEAEGACGGNPDIVAGASLKIGAVGDQFSGTYLVTSATHIYSAKGYTTEFGISGQNSATLLRLLNGDQRTNTTPGMVIGVVTDNQDPQGWGRVKVKYPWLSSDHASDWIRLVVVGGGDRRGIEFIPEVNDEVLVAFEMGDMRHPYIIGGLWNGKEPPPHKNNEVTSGGRVTKRVIRSRTGHMVVLDDSDGQSGITLEDKNGNKIHLDSSANKLTIEVSGDISIKAGGQVDIKGSVINLN
jgi:phage protein D